jgi:hypothetical protein
MELMTFNQFDAPAMTIYDHAASEQLGRDYWCVVNTFRYFIGSPNSKMWVEVPKGYLTDGASIPRPFWNILPPWGRYGQAAIVHDYLCDYGLVLVDGEFREITRAETDRILSESMVVLGVPALKRSIIMSGVNLHRIIMRPGTTNINPEKALLEEERASITFLSDELIKRNREYKRRGG